MACPFDERGAERKVRPWMLKQVQHDEDLRQLTTISGQSGTSAKFSIADKPSSPYGSPMRIILIFVAMLALRGCSGEETVSIPLDRSGGFRDGYLVQVNRGGTVKWNGQKLDDAEFKTYVRQYAALPEGAGRLWVEFEPQAPSDRALFVRKQIVESGLCEQQRCVEGEWGAKRPVVN